MKDEDLYQILADNISEHLKDFSDCTGALTCYFTAIHYQGKPDCKVDEIIRVGSQYYKVLGVEKHNEDYFGKTDLYSIKVELIYPMAKVNFWRVTFEL